MWAHLEEDPLAGVDYRGQRVGEPDRRATFAHQYSAPQCGPLTWAEVTVEYSGMIGVCGARSASTWASSGRIGSIRGEWYGTSTRSCRAKIPKSFSSSLSLAIAEWVPASVTPDRLFTAAMHRSSRAVVHSSASASLIPAASMPPEPAVVACSRERW